MAVNREEHEALSGDTFAEPSKSGALELIYAHLPSTRNIGVMVEPAKEDGSDAPLSGDWVTVNSGDTTRWTCLSVCPSSQSLRWEALQVGVYGSRPALHRHGVS